MLSTIKTKFLMWIRTGDNAYPYEAYSDCKLWKARVNEGYPEQVECLFSIVEGNEAILHFDEWPDNWPIIG